MTESWTMKPSVLFAKENLSHFIPSSEMTFVEKINAITRFSIYAAIILFLLHGDLFIFFVPIIGMLFIYFVISQSQHMESLKEDFGNVKKNAYTEPSNDNPFMNSLPFDNPNRLKAHPPTTSTKAKIEKSFDFNLYKDVTDVYGNNNSQRQYYTMPSTTTPNAQDEFASWLYNKGPSHKEGISW
jgi:hypothetical protein